MVLVSGQVLKFIALSAKRIFTWWKDSPSGYCTRRQGYFSLLNVPITPIFWSRRGIVSFWIEFLLPQNGFLQCTVMHRVEMCMYFCFKVFLKKLWVLVNNQKVLSSCRKGILLKVGQNETANFFFFNVWNTTNAWTTTPPFKITIKRRGINCDAGFPRTAKCCLR